MKFFKFVIVPLKNKSRFIISLLTACKSNPSIAPLICQCSPACNARHSSRIEVDKKLLNQRTRDQLMVAIRVQRATGIRIYYNVGLRCEYQIYAWPWIFKNVFRLLNYLTRSKLKSKLFSEPMTWTHYLQVFPFTSFQWKNSFFVVDQHWCKTTFCQN